MDCDPKEGAVGDPRVALGSRAVPVEAAVAGPVVEHDMNPCCPDAPGVDAVSLGAGAWRTDELDRWWVEDLDRWFKDEDGVEVYDWEEEFI